MCKPSDRMNQSDHHTTTTVTERARAFGECRTSLSRQLVGDSSSEREAKPFRTTAPHAPRGTNIVRESGEIDTNPGVKTRTNRSGSSPALTWTPGCHPLRDKREIGQNRLGSIVSTLRIRQPSSGTIGPQERVLQDHDRSLLSARPVSDRLG